MRFLIDANLPRSAIAVLEKFRHQVEFARDVGLAEALDEQVAAHALRTASVLLTRDLDFADVRRYPPELYAGIVVLRLHDDAVAVQIVEVLERFLQKAEFVDLLEGRLAIIEYDRVRFRPPISAG
jgi:predicted nuclease of predicted toxin-antitoxin system